MYILTFDASWEIPSRNLCQLNKEKKKKKPQTTPNQEVSLCFCLVRLLGLESDFSPAEQLACIGHLTHRLLGPWFLSFEMRVVNGKTFLASPSLSLRAASVALRSSVLSCPPPTAAWSPTALISEENYLPNALLTRINRGLHWAQGIRGQQTNYPSGPPARTSLFQAHSLLLKPDSCSDGQVYNLSIPVLTSGFIMAI